jgi:hypothetical protein
VSTRSNRLTINERKKLEKFSSASIIHLWRAETTNIELHWDPTRGQAESFTSSLNLSDHSPGICGLISVPWPRTVGSRTTSSRAQLPIAGCGIRIWGPRALRVCARKSVLFRLLFRPSEMEVFLLYKDAIKQPLIILLYCLRK